MRNETAPPRVNTANWAIGRLNNYRDGQNRFIPFSAQLQAVQSDPAAYPVQDYATFYDLMWNSIPQELKDIYKLEFIDSEGNITDVNGAWVRVRADDPISNLRSTQDRVAKGVEIELVANPTRNWRLLLNVSEQKTINDNTAPVMGKVVEDFTAKLRASGVGGLRMDATGTTVLRTIEEMWLMNVAEVRAVTALDGTVSAEQRRWRATTVASYRFTDGWMRGFRVGGALRWEDRVATGYVYALDPEVGVPVPLVDQPLMSSSIWGGDAFISYNKRLKRKMEWSIRLHARNLVGNRHGDDVPVVTNPDGRVAVVRIPSPRTFTLTTNLSF
jgi:outer membrane receptor protein involved in Fe transport